jgi:hypothetical protein
LGGCSWLFFFWYSISSGDVQIPVKLELKDLDITPTYIHAGNKEGDADDLINVRYYLRLRLANSSGGEFGVSRFPEWQKGPRVRRCTYTLLCSHPDFFTILLPFRTFLEHKRGVFFQEGSERDDPDRCVRSGLPRCPECDVAPAVLSFTLSLSFCPPPPNPNPFVHTNARH